MKQYVVKITDAALKDMKQIYDYIAFVLLSPETAAGQYDRIAAEILKLDSFPERFQVIADKPDYTHAIRRMLIDNFSVFYIIKDDSVIVTDVLYGASDITARLKG
jgi:plasmid stabilization system protein ParE